MKLRRSSQSPAVWLCVGLLSWTLCSALGQDPDPICYNSRAGLPACNFDINNCFHEGADVKPAWRLVKPGTTGPVEPYEETYVYLDPKESQGEPRVMKANIAAGKKAICVKFFYATSGNVTVPLNIYIRDGDSFSLMHHVAANTGGAWETTHFSCCLPNVQSVKAIAIEATSTDDAIVALDHMDITVSDMPCENDQLSCYPAPPPQAPLDPVVSSPTCVADVAATDAPSCDFTSQSSHDPDTCGWELSSGWAARQKIDGSGRHDTLYSRERDAYLLSDLSLHTGSLCIEIQFATDNTTADLSSIFSLSLHDQNETLFTSAAYNYDGSKSSVWKRNIFFPCLPKRLSWQMRLISKTKGLQIDYIHTKASQAVCASSGDDVTKQTQTLAPGPSRTTPSTRQSTGHDVLDAGEEIQAAPVLSGARFGYKLILVVAGCGLIVLASLSAVAWECHKRRQIGALLVRQARQD